MSDPGDAGFRGKDPLVELIYDPDCPHLEDARRALQAALSAVGMTPYWTEWNRKSPGSPAYARRFGSPTLLVDGRDVAGVPASEAVEGCRLYPDGSGALQGAPPVDRIAASLRRCDSAGRSGPDHKRDGKSSGTSR